jgi:hypothetical protein
MSCWFRNFKLKFRCNNDLCQCIELDSEGAFKFAVDRDACRCHGMLAPSRQQDE